MTFNIYIYFIKDTFTQETLKKMLSMAGTMQHSLVYGPMSPTDSVINCDIICNLDGWTALGLAFDRMVPPVVLCLEECLTSV